MKSYDVSSLICDYFRTFWPKMSGSEVPITDKFLPEEVSNERRNIILEAMEVKPEFHTFSYITVSGRLYDTHCLVHSIDKRYLKFITDHFGVITSGKVQPYSFNVNASPIEIFNIMRSEGYHMGSNSSGPNYLFKTWIFIKEGLPCNCSCHVRPDPPEEGASPPKRTRVENSKETENQDENEVPVSVDNYKEIMEYFQIPTRNDQLTSAQLFALLSTAGFQAPFRS